MQPVRYGDTVGSYYRSTQPNGTLMIVAIGAPNMIDVDNLRNAPLLLESGYDIITPEYYWFCRSNGIFTPFNSIQTLIDTKNTFRDGIVQDIYSGENLPVRYDRFVFLGLSYGWWVVPLLPRFDPSIDTIGLLYPVTEYASFGKRGVKEETVEDFLSSIRRGFTTQYRGIDDPEWSEHFSDRSGLTPLYNIEHLQDANVFLAHGTKDVSIYFEKTREYAAAIRAKFPDNNIAYKEYEWLWHGLDTMIPATKDFIAWLKNIGR